MRRTSHLSTLRLDPATGDAKALRARHTDVEQKLWYHLRDRRLNGFKFRRQVPLGCYIVDFLSEELRLVVEADGGQHADQVGHDAARTKWLESQGYRVVRYWNSDVVEDIDSVLEDLLVQLQKIKRGQT